MRFGRFLDTLRRKFVALAAAAILGSAGLFHAVPARAQAEPESPQQAYAEAFELYAGQLYEQAVLAFQAFRTTYPEHVNTAEALYYQAESALALGHEREAVRLLRIFRRDHPSHPLALQAGLALGRYFYEDGACDDAIEVLADLLRVRPTPEVSAKALYIMAESALRAGRTDEGFGYFQRAADEHRDTETAPRALFALAYAQIEHNRLDEAARTFETLSARYPDSPFAQRVGVVLAEVYYNLDQYEQVIGEIERRLPALEGEGLERAEFLMAESLNKLGRRDEAEAYYRRFTEERPDSPFFRPALYGAAFNALGAGDYEKAAELFSRVRRGHSDEMAREATYHEGVSRARMDRRDEALRLWGEYLRTWPEGALAGHALHESALALYELQEWEEAISLLTRLIREYPNEGAWRGEALYLRGNANLAIGEAAEAARDFEQALAEPGLPDAMREETAFQQAWVQYAAGRFGPAAEAMVRYAQTHAQSPRAADATFWAGESFYEAGRLEDAIRLHRQYLEQFEGGGHTAPALYTLAWAQFKNRDYRDAAAAFERFLSVHEGDGTYRTDALLRLADSYYALRRFEDAIATYRRASGEGEGADYVLYQTGQAQANRGNLAEALATFRDLRARYPQGQWAEEAQYQIGSLLFQEQQYDAAIAEYRRLIQDFPRDPLAARAQYSIGDALFNAGMIDEAVAAYTEVLERYPTSPYAGEAAAGIQSALASAGREREAAQFFDRFQRQNPDSPALEYLRLREAESFYEAGQMDRAETALKAFISTSRNRDLLPDAYYYLAELTFNGERYNETAAYLRRILQDYRSSPRRADAALLAGELDLRLEHYSEALEDFRLAESLSDDNSRRAARARLGQGRALVELGELDEAERLLRETADQGSGPASATAAIGLARLYERRGRASDAASMYRQVIGRSQDEYGAEAQFRLGALLLRQGDANEALRQLDLVPSAYPDYRRWVALSYLEQARAHRALNQPAEAARLYDLVTRDFANTEFAATAAREKGEL